MLLLIQIRVGMSTAVTLLRASDLPRQTQLELFDLYQEDLDEHSEATALEKLESGIQEEQDAS